MKSGLPWVQACMPKDIATLLHEPEATVAVVGATDNPAKYGSIIYRDLKGKGFKVFPVNPNRATVDGDPAYASLADLPEAPTIVDYVVPPHVTLRVLHEAVELGYLNAWVQPGAGSGAVSEFLEANGFNALVNACIMVRSPVHAATE